MPTDDGRDPLADKLLTVGEAARLLDVSPGTILNRVRDGTLRGLRVGKTLRPLAVDVRRLAGCAK